MLVALGAVVPIFLLIILGYVFRRAGWLDDSFWVPAEKLTYFVTFPALLLVSCAKARLDAEVVPLAISIGLATFLVGVLAVLLRGKVKCDDPSFSSSFQGSIRPNTYGGIAAILALHGKEGLMLMSVCIAVVVPMVNLFSVLAMLRWGEKREGVGVIKPVIGNPLIWGCVIGLLLNWYGLGLPPFIGPLLEILGQTALPIGLMAVGAGLSFRLIGRRDLCLWLPVGLKLILLPLLVIVGGVLLKLGPLAFLVALIYAAQPTSPSSYILARQMGGNAQLMAAIISLETLVAAVTLPLVIGGYFLLN